MFAGALTSSLHSNLPSVFCTEAFFGVYSSEEVKKMSVVKIVTTSAFNVLGHPLPGGLYDPRLGPCDRMTSCTTCGQMSLKCPGHIGHIELPLIAINPLFHKRIYDILSISCLQCYHIILPIKAKALLISQLRILNAGFLVEAANLESYILSVDDSDAGRESSDLFLNFLANKLDTYIKNLKKSKHLSNDVTDADKSFKSYDGERDCMLKAALDQFPKRDICPLCKWDRPVLSFSQNKILYSSRKRRSFIETEPSKSKGNASPEKGRSGQFCLNPSELKTYLQNIWSNEKQLVEELIPVLKRSSSPVPTDMIFLDAVLVTPASMRPFNMVRNSPVEHPSNSLYKTIITNCLLLRSILVLANKKEDQEIPEEILSITNRARGETAEEKLQTAWHELQSNVDLLLVGKVGSGNNNSVSGLKQVIEKKDGIIRMNMMGKRVNFAARSVITPDPNIDINEIGFPEAFAKVLTYPVPVTPWNVVELRELVKNGPNNYPGAVGIITENGYMHRISEKNHIERESLAKRLLTPEETAKGGKVVLRHLMNGDILLANRQPTLHKPSIMAHKARILKGEKTLRLHYANCKSYNADFDGDEMNTHFAQNEVARSEAYNIVNVTKQYLVPKDGTPLSGLIQDHVIAGVHLTMRGKFFDKDTYMHLVYQALSFTREPIKIMPPCMIKPKQLWSGKQVISTVIVHLTPKGKFPLNLDTSAKIPVKAWGFSKFATTLLKNPKSMSESEVVIRKGLLLSGVIDKNHCGATSFGLVHSFYELYGGEASSRLLSSFSKLFTCFLQLEGFTLDVKDILVKPQADAERSKIIRDVRTIGPLVATGTLSIPPDSDVDAISEELEKSYQNIPNFAGIIDREYKRALDEFTNSINATCLPAGLLEEFPRNNLQLMVQSGAKGSTVNTMQISCLLGQIELEGKRPPLMSSGRSLPSFKPYDTSPRAGGFIDGRFMTGIQPQEFFFHCMAGREGLIDTAVKTSRSGYLQRCLIKHLEGLVVNYDMTVRDGDGSVIQFLYGEDGLDVCKSQYFKSKLLPFLEENMESIVDKSSVKQFKKQSEQSLIKSHKKGIKTWKKNNVSKKHGRQGSFLKYSADLNRKDAPARINPEFGRSYQDLLICQKWKDTSQDIKKRYLDSNSACPDPVLSRYAPGSYFGSVSEKLDEIIENFLDSRVEIPKNKQKTIRDMMNYKSMISICPPGEPVGVLAAQSIGEPSTQMTLNTFHFAGRGEMNVTLGVPRLREILTIATKNLKTPCVDVPFLPCETVGKLEKRADKLRKSMMKITLSDVLEYIRVVERLDLIPHRHLTYELHLQFLPRKAYKHKTNVKSNDILKHVENDFLSELSVKISKSSKRKAAFVHENAVKSGRTNANTDYTGEEKEEGAKVVGKKKLDLDSDSSGESGGEDEDATVSKRRTQQQEQQYDEPEEGEKEAYPIDDEDIIICDTEENIDTQDREFNVLEKFQYVNNYKYDTKDGLWCKITLWLPLHCQHMDFSSVIRKVAETCVIYEIPNIKRAITYPNNGKTFLKTDGINLNEMFSYCDILDLNKLYSNDIHCIAQTYGIEAAARVIVKEVQNVFQVYGITVDPRHLLLVADYMTFDGTYSPLNRTGIAKNSSSIQQMTFECSLNFLKNAALQGKTDLLQSPSSRIFVGKHCQLGTGMLDVLIKT